MKKLLFTLSLILTIWGLSSQNAFASHMAGSDMEFKCLGKDTYQIVLRVYRDCTGIPINSSPQITFTPEAPCTQGTKSVTMTRTLVRPVRFMCAGMKNICEGGAFPFGMEENRFEVTVIFNNLWSGGLDSTCCWIRVTYQECCRNGNITNIPGANFYIDAELNRCVTPCNSSPQISNYPVAVVCAGQGFWFNNGILDTINYDSISYELADPLGGTNSPTGWLNGFSKEKPFNFLGFPNYQLPFPAGFNLNKTNGDLGFTPMGQQQPVLAFQITEWRKVNGVYQKIGITRRDVQFYTYQCPPNNPPEIEVNGSKAGPWSYTICAGQTLCLNIKATDKDTVPPKSDTTLLSWNRGIPGATWTNVNSPKKLIRWDEAVFCWTPPASYASTLPYYFTVKGEDDNCPVPGTSTRAIGIRVKPSPEGFITKTPLGCSKYGFDVTVTNQNKLSQTPTFLWTIPRVGNGNFNAINAVNYNAKTVPTHSFAGGGTYVIRLRMEGDQCVSFLFDTVYVDSPVKAVACPDTFVCIGNTQSLSAIAKNGTLPYKFKWLTGNSADTLTTLTITNNQTTKEYFIEVTDSFNCISKDSVILEVKPLPDVNVGPDKRICFADSAVFDAGDNQTKGLLFYEWITPDGNRSSQIIYAKDSGQYMIKVIDSFRCEQRDTALLFVNRQVIANAGPNDSICINNSTVFRGSGGQTYEWREIGSLGVISTADTLFKNPTQPGITDITLKVTVTYGSVTCASMDTTTLVANPLPTISFSNKSPGFCIDSNWLDPGTKSGAQPSATGRNKYGWYGGWWTISDLSKSQCFDRDSNSATFGYVKLNCLGVCPQDLSGNFVPWKVTYHYINSNGCYSRDSIDVTIYPLPIVTIGADKSICQNDNPFQIYPYPNTGVGTKWMNPPSPYDANDPNSVIEYNPLGRIHTFFPKRAVEDTTYMLMYEATTQYPKAQCKNTDTAFYYIRPVPKVDAGRLPDVCEDASLVDLPSKSGAKVLPVTMNGVGTWTGPSVNTPNKTFNPKTAPIGMNIIQYSFTNDTGCTSSDTTYIIVNKLPNTQLANQPDICEDAGTVVLKGNKPGLGTGTYIVNGFTTGNSFNAKPAATQNAANPVNYGMNYATYSFTDNHGCKKDAKDSFDIQVLPKVKILNPGPLCEGFPFTLQGSMTNTSSFRWSVIGDGKYYFGTPTQYDTTSTDTLVGYIPGLQDVFNGSFIVILHSTDNKLCPASYDQSFVKINRNPVGDFTAKQEGCEPFPTTFFGNFEDADSIIWDFGDGTTRIGGETVPHMYDKARGTPYDVSVRLVSVDGCDTVLTKPLFIKVNISPTAKFEPNPRKSTVALPRFTFNNKSDLRGLPIDSVNFSWDFGDPKTDFDTSSQYSPTYTYPTDTGVYEIRMNLVTVDGCKAEAIDYVRIDPDITVFAPTAFRPQSKKEQNQRFYVVVDGQRTFHVDIFNRWGELVYSSDDPEEGWDGKYKGVDVQQDVFAWQVTVISFNGTPYKYSGTVTLLR